MSIEATLVPNPGTDAPRAPIEVTIPDANAVLNAGVVDTPIVTEPPKPEVPKEDKNAQRFAILARKEKAIVQKQEDFKARESAFAVKEQSFKAYEEAKANAQLDPLKALEALGLSYAYITNFVLNDSKPTPDMEVKSVKDELAEYKKQQQDERSKLLADEKAKLESEEKQVVETVKGQIFEFLKANPDDYELTNLYEYEDKVYEVIEEHYAQKTKVLSYKEAADLVEKYLESEVDKVTTTKKFQAKALPQPKEDTKQSTPAQSRTLHNQMQPPTSIRAPAKTDAERYERAMAALQKQKQ